MAADGNSFRGRGTGDLLSDKDWMIAIDALINGSSAESKRLARKLLLKTKHGRQVQLLHLLQHHRPRIQEMERLLRVSRRSVFRYLNSLEDYGVRVTMSDDFRYEIAHLPPDFKRLLQSQAAARQR